MDPLPSSAPLCACGTLAVWFPPSATTAAAAKQQQQQQQQQRGATAATTAAATAATAASSLLGPAFAALKSSPASSSSAGQWLVGKKPATLTMSASSSSSRGGVLVQIHAGGRRLVAVSAPYPAACRMVPPSATTGGEGEGEGGESGSWILVAGVREAPPSFPRDSPPAPPPPGDARGDGLRAPGSEGQLLAKIAFRVDASSDGAGLDRMLRESCLCLGRSRFCAGAAAAKEEGAKAAAAAAAAAESDEAGDARAPLPLPPPPSPLPVVPLPPPAPAEAPSPSPLAQKPVEETAAGLEAAANPRGLGGDAADDSSLDPLDLAALAALGDDERLAALLEGMLREEGGDELFRRVFERVDGAVAEALMAASAAAAAEEGAEGSGGGGSGGGGGGLEE